MVANAVERRQVMTAVKYFAAAADTQPNYSTTRGSATVNLSGR